VPEETSYWLFATQIRILFLQPIALPPDASPYAYHNTWYLTAQVPDSLDAYMGSLVLSASAHQPPFTERTPDFSEAPSQFFMI